MTLSRSRRTADQARALIVAGPTCSGKSALALAIAERLDGVIINADSMQVYRELRVLTARPTPAETARVPHALYGVRPAAEPGSAAWWRDEAVRAMDEARAAGRLPILCGGTGLYFSALIDGLSDIPPIDEAVRREVRTLLATGGAARVHARLAAVDPDTAARLAATDGQRLARALEVVLSTGRGLAQWQAATDKPDAWGFAALLLDPPRDALRAAIATRFDAMLAAGAMEEVAALLDLGLDPALPVMRAHGVPELSAVLRGEMDLLAAAARVRLLTGQYTKRQATWFRHHQLADPSLTHTIHARFADVAQFSESFKAKIEHFIRSST